MISSKRTESDLKAPIDELCTQLTISHRAAKQKEDALQNTIKSLRKGLVVQNTKSSTSFVDPHSSMLVIYVNEWVSRKLSKSSAQNLLIPSRESRRPFVYSEKNNVRSLSALAQIFPLNFQLSSQVQKIGDNHPTAPYPAFRLSAERQN